MAGQGQVQHRGVRRAQAKGNTAQAEYLFGRWLVRRMAALRWRMFPLGPLAQVSEAKRAGIESTGQYCIRTEVADEPGGWMHRRVIGFVIRDWRRS